ncbi:MAG: AraC family ligand binding domain-containing protein, partial [Opitutaceae bacterium]|nr:AraC family ligand binding domain-containing protein [Opitutaceae bacterium]
MSPPVLTACQGIPVSPLPFSSVCLNSKPHHYRCPRDWCWNTRLADYDLWIALGGSGRLVIDGKPLVVTGPLAVLICPGESVSGTHDPRLPFEVVALHFSPRCRNRDGLRVWAERMRAVPLRPAAMWREFAGLVVTQLAADDALAHQQAGPLVMSLLSGLWRQVHTAARRSGGGGGGGDPQDVHLV